MSIVRKSNGVKEELTKEECREEEHRNVEVAKKAK